MLDKSGNLKEKILGNEAHKLMFLLGNTIEKQ